MLANKRSDNTPLAILKAIKELQKQVKGLNLANALFSLEHTGIYAYPLLDTLKKEEASIWLEQVAKVILSMHEELPFTPIKIDRRPVCGCLEERR